MEVCAFFQHSKSLAGNRLLFEIFLKVFGVCYEKILFLVSFWFGFFFFECTAKNAGIPCTRCISIGDRYDIDVAVPLQLGMGGIVTECIDDVYHLPDLLITKTY